MSKMDRTPTSATMSPAWRRRTLLQTGSLVLLLGARQLAQGAGIVAVRVWPAADYTRVTIESDASLKATHRMVGSPPRLALDIEGLDLNPALRELVAKVRADDPNIAGIRVGQNAPGVVRMVIDLKQAIKPQVFTLAPIAAYRHRLVFDLYPANPRDPLEALIAERTKELATPKTAPAPSVAAAPAATGQDALGDLIAKQIERADTGGQRPSAPAPAPAAPRVARAPAPRQPAPAPAPAPSTAAPAPPFEAPASGESSGESRTAAAAPAAPAPTPSRPPFSSRTDRLIIVALDPGHGGEDPGAIGPGGTYEKDVVLQVALKLRDRINNTVVAGSPMRAFLTRDADFFVPLGTRVEKARRVGADLFISIHADAFMRPDARGASVYALSEGGASSAAARWLAQKENQADQIGGVNVVSKDALVQRTLLDMSTTAQIKDSLKLGDAVLRQIGGVGHLHKPRVERAGFAVLKAPDIPSVLVETAFISNPDEERKLRTETYQDDLANALILGIQKYFAANPPLARSRQI